MMPATYDAIGAGYASRRKPDPRIAAMIWQALGVAGTVLNVGAGSGSYEPSDRSVIAVEPSARMIRQRPPSAGPAVLAIAEALPFPDGAFDAAMAVNTVHHWSDKAKGFAEMRRVARGPVVVLTSDPDFRAMWQLDYFPQLAELDDRQMPRLADYRSWLGDVDICPVPVPHDCQDGFLYAYWRRPQAYLDARVRAAMSSFHALGDVSAELARLSDDLANGCWSERYGHLLAQDSLDVGYRLVVSRSR